MLCIIMGHDWSPAQRGAGQFINRQYMVCNRCGASHDIGPVEPQWTVPVAMMPNAFERLESDRATRAKAMRSPVGAADTTPLARRSLRA